MKPFNPFFFLFLSIFAFVSLVHAPELNITVTTDKRIHYLEETVHIYGNFTVDGQPIPDGLVALEVNDPTNTSIIFRTLQTGNISIPEGPMQIVEAFASDEYGNPKYAFKPGSPAYFNITIKNIGIPQSVWLFVSIYDESLQPIGIALTYFSLLPTGSAPTTILPMLPNEIPEWATIGNATLYVNLFTNWPSAGGYPYCLEKSATFEIVDPPQATTIIKTERTKASHTNGTYSSAFRLPHTYMLGNYTAHVSARYQQQQVMSHTTFEVKFSGDANGDGKVNYEDLFILAAAYGSYPGHDRWNPDCDFNNDDIVNWKDLFTLAANYGRTF